MRPADQRLPIDVPTGPTDGPGPSATLDRVLEELDRADELQPGEVLGDYTILRFVASGGEAEIYEAEQGGGLGRRVALKLQRGLDTDEDRDRFVREGQLQAGAGLHHQGVLPVLAAGRDGDRVFLILPFVR